MRDRIKKLPKQTLQVIAGAFVAIAMASTATLFATDYTNGGITLSVPSYTLSVPLYHCEPQNDPTADKITVSGIAAGSTVKVNFTFSSGVAGEPLIQIPQTLYNVSGSVSISIPYPEDASTWPGFDGTNRSIVVAVAVAVTPPGGLTTKVTSKQWKVICKPDVPDTGGFNGCTLGYWKQEQHFDSWTLYAPSDSFNAVFGVTSALNPPGNEGTIQNPTLLQALEIGGGGENGMARQAVAALLNSTSPGVNYQMTTEEVIAAVQAAYAAGTQAAFNAAHAQFESYNLALVNGVHICPLN
jgi:hypothetical protein